MDNVKDHYYGQYVKYYNPNNVKLSDVFLDESVLQVASDINEAKKFINSGDALEYWRQVDTNCPTRPWDGKPNRPLTAWCAEVINILLPQPTEPKKQEFLESVLSIVLEGKKEQTC